MPRNAARPPWKLSMISKTTLAQKRLLVVGDSMLDRYWFGDTNRISPEAPVPVVKIVKNEDRLGGAANVALNIAELGARASLMSVIGNDDAGRSLQAMLKKAGIEDLSGVDDSVRTTVKLRVLARRQQLVRIDFEDHPANEVLATLTETFEAKVKDFDALVLSDYGKGGLDHIVRMIDAARQANVPVLIDPKGSDYSRYRGATLITPNRAELALVIGEWKSEAELIEKAQKLRQSLELTALLLTRSEEGMTLFTDEGEFNVPAQAREVFDVSGAGDTSIAVTAAMIAAGLDLTEAVRIANRAGGIVVGKLGTASVTYDELFGKGN